MKLAKVALGFALLVLCAGIGLLSLGQSGEQPQISKIEMKMDPPYTPNKDLADDYRCFLLNPNLTQDTYVSAYEIFPDQADLVHHVILFTASASAIPQAEATDRSDDGPGWTCFGGTEVAGAGSLSSSLGVWAPGGGRVDFPTGTVKRLKAGTQIIMQVHYNVTGGELKPDATRAEITTTSDTSLKILNGFQVASAVEIRCPGAYPTDVNDRCHRSYAQKQVEDPGVNESLHLVCGTNSGLYTSRDVGAGDAQDVSCKMIVRRQGDALGAFGHMHLRGKSLKMELNPDTADAKVVLDIPHWNFKNQEQYWLEEPIALNVGDIIKITCVYDNSGPIPGPDGAPLEPRYIIWGEGTTDEMCLGLINWVAP